jgi:hypothetical protein
VIQEGEAWHSPSGLFTTDALGIPPSPAGTHYARAICIVCTIPCERLQHWSIRGGFDRNVNEITIVGLGLGYHVAACLKRYPWVRRIKVLECHAEVIHLAIQWVPNLTEDPRISIQLVDSETAIRQAIGLADIANVYLHPPSVALIPYDDIRALLEEMQMLRTNIANQLNRLMENWEKNSPSIHAGNVLTGRQDSRRGQPGILVAAGPSLDYSLPFLQRIARHATVISVSAALKTLLKSGVVPDYCVVSDSSSKICAHFTEIESTTDLPELFVLGTAFPGIVNLWSGKVTWLLQRGFGPAESLAAREGYDHFQTGGSVATLALSVMYYLGCDPIVFVGQDLAYVDNRTHGQGIHQELTGVGSSPAFAITVESVEGKPILSNVNWNSF